MNLSASLHTSEGPQQRDAAAGASNGAPGSAASGLRLYGEADLVPLAGAQRGGVPRLVNDLLAAGSARQREAVVRTRLHGMGFEWMGYGCIDAGQGAAAPRQAYLTTYMHDAWAGRYFGQRYDEVDPRLLAPSRSSLPLVWDLQDIEANIAARPAPARARRFVDDLAGSGIHSGIFLRIAAAAGPQVVVSLMCSAPNRRWIGDRVLGEALTFALSLHEFMSQHVQLPQGPGAPVPAATRAAAAGGLPAIRQELLRLVVHGLTDKEIADRLQVSLHTVDYHLRQLRQRFGARNRVQLVNAAAQALA
jgi:DNA-binding CsgD family transcriptional regulator